MISLHIDLLNERSNEVLLFTLDVEESDLSYHGLGMELECALQKTLRRATISVGGTPFFAEGDTILALAADGSEVWLSVERGFSGDPRSELFVYEQPSWDAADPAQAALMRQDA